MKSSFLRVSLIAVIWACAGSALAGTPSPHPGGEKTQGKTTAAVSSLSGFSENQENKTEPSGAIPVVELFSSRACMFCPAAERILGDLVRDGKALGVTCMVDYFQSDKDDPVSASCIRRQESYAGALKSGPVYTPQIVINGSRDVVGYRRDDIANVLASDSAGTMDAARIMVRVQADAKGEAVLVLGLPSVASSQTDGKGNPSQSLILEAIVYQESAQEPGSKARPLTNLVVGIESLGGWNGMLSERAMPLPRSYKKTGAVPETKGQGILVLAIDSVTRAIVAAGKFSDTP